MVRAVGTFCNNHYFPISVPFLNSLFYNDVQARIKVYDHSGLNHLLRTYLAKFVDVIELTDKSVINKKWLHGCLFRPVMLAQLGFDDVELFLDSDMVVLSDLKWPLDIIKSGKFVCSTEWVCNSGTIDIDVTRRWNKIAGSKPPTKFDVANGGLLGFNFSKHYQLAKKWATVCCDESIYSKSPFDNDQMVISGLLDSLKIDRHKLPKKYWMTTWRIHNNPPKVLGFNEQGKIRLYDTNTGKPIQIYHYTGGIDQKIDGNTKIIRYYHSRGESILEPSEMAQKHVASWKNLWEKRYRSPAGILADHMRDIGPIKVPKVFSAEFRNKASIMLQEILHHKSTKRTYAFCIAYDYITLLNYKLGNECWLEKPLRAMLGDKIYKGDKVLKWDEPSDVTLSFGNQDTTHNWTGNCFSMPGQAEHLNGVNIIFS